MNTSIVKVNIERRRLIIALRSRVICCRVCWIIVGCCICGAIGWRICNCCVGKSSKSAKGNIIFVKTDGITLNSGSFQTVQNSFILIYFYSSIWHTSINLKPICTFLKIINKKLIGCALYEYKSGIRVDKISIINTWPGRNRSGLCKRVYIEYFQRIYITCFDNDLLTIWTKMNIISSLRHSSYHRTIVDMLKSEVPIYWVYIDSTRTIPNYCFLEIWWHQNGTIRNRQIDCFTCISSKIVNFNPILTRWRFEIGKDVWTIHEDFRWLIRIISCFGCILIGQRSIKTNTKK